MVESSVASKPIYKRWWFWVCILALIGKIVETTEDPKIRACKDSAFSYYYNNKNFEEQLHRYDTDGGATLKSIILRLEDLYDLQYRGCEQK